MRPIISLLTNTDSSFLNTYAEGVFDSCRYFPKFHNSSSDIRHVKSRVYNEYNAESINTCLTLRIILSRVPMLFGLSRILIL